jgi:hypothetical protein
MTQAAPAEPSIVQFPHPGPERFPKPLTVGAELPWNTGQHGRKFLLAPGTWTDGDGDFHDGDLTFWGEWEPQSTVVEVLPSGEPGLPRALQRPSMTVTDTGWHQNTDPLVFGDAFAYTNCKQQHISKLKQLAAGSVVLFGSKLGGGFVLDTVFVVASSEPYRPIDGTPAGVSAQVADLVAEPLALDPSSADSTFTWYRGATPDNPVDSMFSFVPAKPYERGEVGFARPYVRLEGLLNPNLAMSAKTTVVTAAEAQVVWDTIAEQVLDAGLVMATQFPLPEHHRPELLETADRAAAGC